ncbi:YeeE/YedE thiosulfate transporter family protein [Falsiroseomonas sp. HC035]|uniref:YeeE/YedE thiosulfate transporter family protein n=1 Tax=Falsiroseomonas sp. HC035 TaxID=3390999 RepID=UPI003D3120B0
MAGALAAAPPRAHLPGLLLGVVGTALAVLGLGDAALLPLLAVAMLLGAMFVVLDYGFTGGFRRLLVDRDGRTLGASFIVPAVAALAILPIGTLVEGFGRFVAPIGPPLVVGAALFGIGMQIASGCGSGTLVAMGQGSRRMWVALPFFCLGGVLGSLVLPAALRLPNLGAVDLPAVFGTWGGLAVTEGLLLAGALLVLRGARPQRDKVLAGLAVGVVVVLLFLVSGMPWGITMGLTLWGGQAVQALGLDLTRFEFWAGGWTREALEGPLLALHGSLTNIGLVLGALLAAAAQGRLRHGTPIGWRGAAGAAIGGLLMGVGARLSFGCNVGAFLGGASSGSLHGFVWVLAAMPGCWVGIRLRPLFGLR